MKSSVYYFSGTGNSYSIAKQLEIRIENTTVYTISGLIGQNVTDDADFIGFVFPVYFQDTPEIVKKFLHKISIKEEAYIYCIVNANTLPSRAFLGAEKALNKQKRSFDALYYFDMPGNSVVFRDYSNPQRIRDYRLAMANHHLDAIIPMILDRVVYKHSLKVSSYTKSRIDRWLLKYIVKDYMFKTDEHCTLCGKCINNCPIGNISIRNGKVRWNHNCVHCWGCLNRCPNHAIQNIATKGRPRYVNPVVELGQRI